MSERLWVCHECERIGSELDAKNHHTGTGHKIEELDQVVSDGVHELWRERSIKRAAAMPGFYDLDWRGV